MKIVILLRIYDDFHVAHPKINLKSTKLFKN